MLNMSSLPLRENMEAVDICWVKCCPKSWGLSYTTRVYPSGSPEEWHQRAVYQENEQSIPSFWLKCILGKSSEQSLERSLSSDDVLFVAESKIIEELAEKGLVSL